MNYKKAYEESLKKCSELEKEIERLRKFNENKDLQIEHLTGIILKRNQMLFGRKSEKSKYVLDGQQTLEGFEFNEAEAHSNLSAQEPTIEKVIKKSKKTGKHRGRKQLREDLETKKVVFELPENERVCSVCGEELTEFAEEYITERLCVIPAQIYLVQYFRKVYKCKNCDKNGTKSNIVKAPDQTPAPVIKRGLPDQSLVADIMQRKYQLGEPLYRQEQYWKLRGIYLTRTDFANWIIKSSKLLEPVVRRFWYYSRKEPVMNADETTLRVLKKHDKQPIWKKGQMWIVATGASASKKIALYTYRDSRTKEVAEELLGNYTGILQTDGMQSYGSGKYIHAGCWAHTRRKFYDCMVKGAKNGKAVHAVELIDEMFKLEREARENNYSPEQIYDMRQTEVKPILEEFYKYIGTLNPGQGSPLAAAINYALNQKEKLLVFLDHPEVEMTNNLAERTVKPFVIDRKNFLFSDTEKGADASARVMTIIETAKRNGLDVYGYLYHLLTVLPQWGDDPTDEQIDSIMPWNSELPDYCRQSYSEIQ